MKLDLKDFPYRTTFAAEIKCIVSAETDKFLSLASLDNLKFLIPQNFIDNQGIDLLPIAFNACVANRCNKNGDSISTVQAIQIAKNFIARPVDLEHKKTDIIGHIINAGFTQFGTDKELSLEDAAKLTDPFNIALAAYIYSITYDDLSEVIEESADPSSLRYKMVSASWELAFKDYKIVKGNKNLSEATIIEDADEKKSLEPLLQANGGKGKDSHGNYIYRLIDGEIYPLGIGLTKNPAAEVKGVFIPGVSEAKEENTSEIVANENNFKNNKEIISNLTNTDVNKIDMKLSTIEDVKGLTDETLKTCNASNLNTVVADEIAKISEQVISERKAKEDAISNASKLSKEVSDVKAELEKIQAAAKAKEVQDTFNARMTSLDENYNLTDAHRKIVAKQIQDLDEASFTAWAADFEILAKSDKKSKADDDEAMAKAKKDKEDKDKADQEAKASKDKADKEKMDEDEKVKKAKESKASTAREFLDKIKISEASTIIPNTTSSTQSLRDKAKLAFNKETVTIKQRR